jgi:dephospho-CoA kinase
VRRILVTGMSGTGKSSVLAELARRGFHTVDTDEPGWTVEDPDGGRWWDEQRIAELLDAEGATLYVSGTVSNQGRFYDRFDAVVLLSAPAEIVLDRISTRRDERLRQAAGRAGPDPRQSPRGRAAHPRDLYARDRHDAAARRRRRPARRDRRRELA